jgi:tetratricopeptide (TPR) repeat protein
MLEVQAFSLESIGAYDKAVESFKKLFAKTNNNYYGFSQANLQYVLKDYSGAYATLLQVEKLNDTGNYTVSYAINQTHKQEIELIAAIQYLKGLCAVQLKNNPVAKASFEKALTTQPDFVLAKEALENLQPK